MGGTVFDTAPSYGASEEVAGRIAHELGITDRIFWATKVNVAGRGGGAPTRPRRAHRSRRRSEDASGPIDLIQVHNLGDVPTQLGILKELKQRGPHPLHRRDHDERRALRATSMHIMRNEPIDFIGIDYAVDNREVEETILPLAQERRIGVLVYAPFGRTRLWAASRDREVPDWAPSSTRTRGAQFFLKFVASIRP
jgi:aryl-alcohol dehydrogenase-like predicted oxidoreductase